jgi:hypothetical protein
VIGSPAFAGPVRLIALLDDLPGASVEFFVARVFAQLV